MATKSHQSLLAVVRAAAVVAWAGSWVTETHGAEWQAIGPEGGDISALAVDPQGRSPESGQRAMSGHEPDQRGRYPAKCH